MLYNASYVIKLFSRGKSVTVYVGEIGGGSNQSCSTTIQKKKLLTVRFFKGGIMKKLLVILVLALIPSFAFATTTTATIGGTLKVYETLSLDNVRVMIWPAQYAGNTTADLFTSTGLAAASGITGTDTIGQAGRVRVNGTGGTTYNMSLGAFAFTAGGTGFASLAPVVKICTAEPTTAAECTAAAASQTLPSAGTLAQNQTWYIQGKLPTASALNPGVYTGTTIFTVTYN